MKPHNYLPLRLALAWLCAGLVLFTTKPALADMLPPREALVVDLSSVGVLILIASVWAIVGIVGLRRIEASSERPPVLESEADDQ